MSRIIGTYSRLAARDWAVVASSYARSFRPRIVRMRRGRLVWWADLRRKFRPVVAVDFGGSLQTYDSGLHN